MSYPQFVSGANHVAREVQITDRDNVARTPLGLALVDVQPDWDIDRSGSKGAVSIVTHQGALEPGMWIAPEIVITPETGEIIRQQMGHFRLGKPGITFDGTFSAEDGSTARHQTANGSDIVNDIAAVRLAEAFYTPVLGHIMSDINVLLKLATAGALGSNLVTNGSFEDEQTGWTADHSAGAGSIFWGDAGPSPAPEGVKQAGYIFNTGRATNDRMALYQNVPIPAGTRYLFVMGLALANTTQHRTELGYEWRNEANVAMGTSGTITNGNAFIQWRRHHGVLAVPTGAAFLRLWVRSVVTSVTSGVTYSVWDDIRVHTCTALPLPDDRIDLPSNESSATTYVQTVAGRSIGFDGINADRLNAIGYHAIHTDLIGRVTTRQMRSLDDAEPDRTYGAGDYRLVGVVSIPPSDANVANHFLAIKEDFEDAASSLKAEAYNTNPLDPFSVINTGRVVSADPIMVPDAVDAAALMAVATAARDRASMQEELTIKVLPDPALRVHDVILIDDPAMPEASGKWAIESIRPGMRLDDLTVEIGCRRTIGKGVA